MTAITNARARAFIIISISVVVMLLLLASAGNATNETTATVEYRVQLGDTLWEIAMDHGPNGADPRRIVDAIERLNGIDAGSLQAGQVIEIPASSS